MSKPPVPERKPVNHTLSEEDQALDQAGADEQGFWERSGEWINENWDAIGTFGTAIGAAACVIASFGICLTAGAAVAAGEIALDIAQTRATGEDMRWAENGMGIVGIGASGAFSGWLNGAMRYGRTSRGMREHVSLQRVKKE